MENTFVTCLNCIDGRVQIPVINWIKDNYNIQFVDMITEAGIDGYIANSQNDLEPIIDKINISVNIHKSKLIFIVGHHDCAGNPVSKENHIENIKESVNLIKDYFTDCTVFGLWLDENWQINLVD